LKNPALLLSVIAILAVLAPTSRAFDNQRRGFTLGGGVALAPAARCFDSNGESKNYGSIAINFIFGYAISEDDIIALQIDRQFSETSHTFVGTIYSRFIGPDPRRAFLSIGAGMNLCKGPAKSQGPTMFDWDTDWPEVGFAGTIGGGYEIINHVFVFSRLTIGTIRHGWLPRQSDHEQLILGVTILAY